jgi:hypothetical protein
LTDELHERLERERLARHMAQIRHERHRKRYRIPRILKGFALLPFALARLAYELTTTRADGQSTQ